MWCAIGVVIGLLAALIIYFYEREKDEERQYSIYLYARDSQLDYVDKVDNFPVNYEFKIVENLWTQPEGRGF